MPRKSQTITAVPIEQPTETISTEPLTDAQEMNHIVNEIKSIPEDKPASVIEAPAEPVVMKPKRGARSKKPAKETQEQEVSKIEIASGGEENVVNVSLPEPKTEPAKEAQGNNLVNCPQCHQQVTQKTLRYSHSHNCKSKPTPPEPQATGITEQVIDHAIAKRISCARETRAKQRADKMRALMQDAV